MNRQEAEGEWSGVCEHLDGSLWSQNKNQAIVTKNTQVWPQQTGPEVGKKYYSEKQE